MRFDGMDDRVDERQMDLFGIPVLVKERDGLTGGIECQPAGQARLRGEMEQFIFGKLIETPCSAEVECRIVVRDIWNRRTKIMGRRKRRIAPVRIEIRDQFLRCMSALTIRTL